MLDPSTCRWCGSAALKTRSRVFCSHACHAEWEAAGRGPSLKQRIARLEHAERQPKGAQSVADYLSRGGSIYRGP
jgi:hypothetical protein